AIALSNSLNYVPDQFKIQRDIELIKKILSILRIKIIDYQK
ncbi:8167_t:CDS:1, partial [Entrophospora sp. SA101]